MRWSRRSSILVESIRVARTTRELLKKFAAAYHSFHDHRHHSNYQNSSQDEHDAEPHTPKVNTYIHKALYTEDGMHDKIAITKELFLLIIQDRSIQKLMNDLDLPHDRANLFEIIDADGSGTLQITELLQGLLKIRGEISKSDTIASLLATRAVFSMVSEMKDDQVQQIKELRTDMTRCFSSLRGLQATSKQPPQPLAPVAQEPSDPPTLAAETEMEGPVLDLDQVRSPSKPEAFVEEIETKPPFA